MKYIKKILIILFLVIMISGCKVDYQLSINKDLSVSEKVVVSENTNRMKSRTNLDVDQSVNYLYKIYKNDSMKNDDYAITARGSTTEVTVNNNYKDISDFSSYFSNELFENISENHSKNDIIIDFEQNDLIDSKATNRYIYDEIDVTIELPFEVIKHNADLVDGNKYTWHIYSNTKKYKRIFLEFNGEKLKNNVSFSFGKSVININYIFIIIGFLIVIIGIIFGFLYVNNKKNNKI